MVNCSGAVIVRIISHATTVHLTTILVNPGSSGTTYLNNAAMQAELAANAGTAKRRQRQSVSEFFLK